VSGGNVTHRATPFAAYLVQIPVQKKQDVVHRDILALLIHNGDAVCVAVGGQAQVVAVVPDVGDQQAQPVQVRGRGAPAEEGVAPPVDERHPAARLSENDAHRELPHAVHRIHDHFQAGVTDDLQVNE